MGTYMIPKEKEKKEKKNPITWDLIWFGEDEVFGYDHCGGKNLISSLWTNLRRKRLDDTRSDLPEHTKKGHFLNIDEVSA